MRYESRNVFTLYNDTHEYWLIGFYSSIENKSSLMKRLAEILFKTSMTKIDFIICFFTQLKF